MPTPPFYPLREKLEREAAYLNPQITMQEHLKLPRRLPLIPNDHTRSQPLPSQRNTINQSKLEPPCLFRTLIQIPLTQPKIQLHAPIPALPGGSSLTGALPKKFPPTRSRESMLRQGSRLLMSLAFPKYWENNRDPSANSLGAVCCSSGGQEEFLLS